MTTSAPWTLKNECKCGHHKDSHTLGACTGLYCDCARFRKPNEPDGPEPIKVRIIDETAKESPQEELDWKKFWP